MKSLHHLLTFMLIETCQFLRNTKRDVMYQSLSFYEVGKGKRITYEAISISEVLSTHLLLCSMEEKINISWEHDSEHMIHFIA